MTPKPVTADVLMSYGYVFMAGNIGSQNLSRPVMHGGDQSRHRRENRPAQ